MGGANRGALGQKIKDVLCLGPLTMIASWPLRHPSVRWRCDSRTFGCLCRLQESIAGHVQAEGSSLPHAGWGAVPGRGGAGQPGFPGGRGALHGGAGVRGECPQGEG
jgi:hypothetical protein